jgi:imidazolonepropionase-like amidohydrolase
VSPTINAGWARFQKNTAFVDRVQSNYRDMRAAGIKLVASTDAGIPGVHHHRLPEALPVFAHFAGLSPVEVLRAATVDAANAIGLGGVTGQLSQEYAADLIVTEGDPLADLSVLQSPVAVMAAGRMALDHQ